MEEVGMANVITPGWGDHTWPAIERSDAYDGVSAWCELVRPHQE